MAWHGFQNLVPSCSASVGPWGGIKAAARQTHPSRYPLAASASAERAACAEEQQQLEQQNGEEPRVHPGAGRGSVLGSTLALRVVDLLRLEVWRGDQDHASYRYAIPRR